MASVRRDSHQWDFLVVKVSKEFRNSSCAKRYEVFKTGGDEIQNRVRPVSIGIV
jgi:hypothetical protein